jgi:mannose-1-phosphate guanylyltransferase
VYGCERPKQYAALLGSRSLLRQTLDRVALAIAGPRTVVVTMGSHAEYLANECFSSSGPRVLVQPEDRGTATAVLFAARWIAWRDSNATVAVFPSDHFVVDEAVFMAQVVELARAVTRHPQMIILLGAAPTGPDPEYGWIEPGERLDATTAGPIFRVRRFWEKPSSAAAQACLARGWLWNTLVLVAKVGALIDLGRQVLPSLDDRLSQIAAFLGSADEAWAIQRAYALAPKANFSHAILELCIPQLAVSRLVAGHWSDWGTPERVLAALRQAGLTPGWLSRMKQVG